MPYRSGISISLDPLLSARRICVAPMMDYTDRHFRSIARLLTRHALLYTEMVPTPALIKGDKARFLDHDPSERPVALQLGGNDPAALAECARMAEDWGYDEVNLNVGCPSDRVSAGRFGACLMADPHLVARCVEAMRGAVSLPITVKHRIGVDALDSYEHLAAFIAIVAAAGCPTFIVHARKAWLNGLNPKQNRTIPPLRHDLVHRLKADFPTLTIVTNGGVATLDQAAPHLEHVDGVMIGRAAYDDPYLLADVDRRFHGETAPPPTRREIIERLAPYLDSQVRAGVPARRHIHGDATYW